MRLPIDQTGLTLTAISAPKKVADGEIHLELAAIRDGELGRLRVTLTRDPRIVAGQPVKLEGLAANTSVLTADSVRVVEAPSPPSDQPGP